MDSDYAKYLLKKTRQDYNLIADDFSRTRQSPWEELGFFREYIRDKDVILDVGCGNGRLLDLFKEKDIQYVGIDNSEKLIKLAKEKYSQGRFLTADALNLPFPDNCFDKVFSIAVLHHIPSNDLRQRFFKEIKRVMKTNGFLFLTVWKFHRLKELFFLLKYAFLKTIGKSRLDWMDILEPWGKKAERYYHWFFGRELESLARKAGFKIKKKGIIKNPSKNRQNFYLIAEK